MITRKCKVVIKKTYLHFSEKNLLIQKKKRKKFETAPTSNDKNIKLEFTCYSKQGTAENWKITSQRPSYDTGTLSASWIMSEPASEAAGGGWQIVKRVRSPRVVRHLHLFHPSNQFNYRFSVGAVNYHPSNFSVHLIYTIGFSPVNESYKGVNSIRWKKLLTVWFNSDFFWY